MIGNVMEQLRAKARANPQRIVFPESGEAKILQAARQVRDLGLGHPVLVGKPDAISSLAQDIAVPLEGIATIDHTDQGKVERLVVGYCRVSSDLPAAAIKRKLRDPLFFAALMVKLDEADCMVAGLSHTTGEVMMASEMIIGLKDGISTVSSMGILSVPGYEGTEGNEIAIADCAVCAVPGSEELADIAISTADSVRNLMGWEPRVALLSFSTKGSSSHERVDAVLQALKIVRERRPDILIDGELQLDAAIIPEVAFRKIKGQSAVAGKANVLIFPNLESGNIGVKLVQCFAHAVAYGPLLQGFARPVSDLSRGAPVDEIIGAATMVAVQAQYR